ncbi:MAG: C39 family peptidase [Ktedonobacterales bacterium]
MSGITNTLPHFPLIDQRHESTVDGYPDENANWNCVPASLAAGLTYLTGKQFDGDQLKDAVYGQGYRGAQAARTYVAYCARQGVTLAPFDSGDAAALVARIHTELQRGHPVVLTMPSQWGIPPADPLHPSGSTHVGIACGYGPGMLRVMNPWGGFWHDGTDAYWRARLCYGEIWILSKTQGATSNMAVPAGWKDDGATITAPNGHVVRLGFAKYIRAHPWADDDQPLEDEQAVAQILHEDARWGKGARQLFVRSGLFWAAAPDKAVAQASIVGEIPMGIELRTVERDLASARDALQHAQSQIASLEAQIATLQQQLAAAQHDAPDPLAQLNKTALEGLKLALSKLT